MIDGRPFIRKLEAIEHFTAAEVQQALSLCRDIRPVPRREHIIKIDHQPQHVHIILEGWAARYSVRKDGSRQFTALLVPGDFCDIQALAVRQHDHSIVALTDCKVAFVNTHAVAEAAASSSALSRALLRSTLIDEAILRRWIVNIASGDAQSTLAHLFCEMHLRLRAVGLVEEDTFSLPITQEELADAVGVTTVHVNRILQRMRTDKQIEFRSGLVAIPDVSILRRACGFNPNYLHLLAANALP